MNKITAVILAAGNSTRFGENKLLYKINNESVIRKTLSSFYNIKEINEFVVVSNENFIEEIKEELSSFKNIKYVIGGKTRFDSVLNALKKIDTDIVVIHDGARPYITKEVILDSIKSAQTFGSGIVCVKSTDSIYQTSDSTIEKTLDRNTLVNIQTPQSFNFKEILSAYLKCKTNTYTDDSAIYLEHVGKPHIVYGKYSNKKITVKEDIVKMKDYRIGNGYDIHKLTENRKLILGGITIPYELGLLGHSDADVLLHSIMDALLSASGLKDIGYYFSDQDAKYKDIDSTILLKQVLTLLKDKGFNINNVTATVIAEKPKLKPFHDQIVDNLSSLLNIDKDRIGITFNTKEKLDSVGQGLAIEVHSTVLIYK